MAIKNYTTVVDAYTSIGEIQGALAGHGARRIMTEYEDGRPTGVSFELTAPAGSRVFTLPANVDGVRAARGRRAGYEIQQHGDGGEINMNDDNNKLLLILVVVIVIACIIGPVLIWKSDMPTWLKWLLTK